jgi:hypothetical protein
LGPSKLDVPFSLAGPQRGHEHARVISSQLKTHTSASAQCA